MRQERTIQASLFDLFADTRDRSRAEGDVAVAGRASSMLSRWSAEDLRRDGVSETGRQGLPAESVLRCALLKQHRQLSYEELAFHLEDSASFRAFARLPLSMDAEEVGAAAGPSARSGPRHGRRSIRRCWAAPVRRRSRPATMVRLDSTVADALMHEPSDSSLAMGRGPRDDAAC